jgi:glyoxylase I family protein
MVISGYRAVTAPTKELAMTDSITDPAPGPAISGVHHFSPTVSDVEVSAQWYERVFGMNRVPVAFPHYGDETGGYGVLLLDPRSGVAIGLHHHEVNPGQPFHESRTGLDHISFGVAERDHLHAWASWLDSIGIANSGVINTDNPLPYSVVVFRDPDNIQLELFYMES